MQAEVMYRKSTTMASSLMAGDATSRLKKEKDSRETIHSGHFMVSDFEAEAQDDEDELAVPVPDEEAARLALVVPSSFTFDKHFAVHNECDKTAQQLSIETSLNKLFQCMSLAYR